MLIFTGAGISKDPPSFLPLANEVKTLLLGKLIYKSNFHGDLEKRIHVLIKKHFNSLQMETIFDAYLKCGIENIFECLKSFYYALPNDNHYLIAEACKEGLFKTIFTLNFDHLHQKAFNNSNYQSYLDEESFKNDPINFENINIFHLHNAITISDNGKINMSEIQASSTSMRPDLSKQKSKIFKDYLEKFDVLCVGYSDNDIDTFPLIIESGNNIFWYIHNHNEKPSEKIQKAINNPRLNIKIVERNEAEPSLSDFLSNITGIPHVLDSKKNKKNREDYHLNSIDNSLDSILADTGESIMELSRVVLADIMDICGERDIAINILKTIKHSFLKKTDEPSISKNKKRILAHCYSRKGENLKSFFIYLDLAKIEENEYLQNKYNILSASSVFGYWKRHPYFVIPFIPLYNKLMKKSDEFFQKEIKENENYSALYYFERGDFYHFFGSSFYSFTYPFTYFMIGKIKRKRILKKWYFLCQKGDQLIDAIFKKSKKKHLIRAKYFYGRGLEQDDLDDQYFYLNLCRLLEVSVLLKDVDSVDYCHQKLENAKDYYTNRSIPHGIGNVIIAEAYYEEFFGKGNNISSLLQHAIQLYGNHEAGIIKTLVLAIQSNVVL